MRLTCGKVKTQSVNWRITLADAVSQPPYYVQIVMLDLENGKTLSCRERRLPA